MDYFKLLLKNNVSKNKVYYRGNVKLMTNALIETVKRRALLTHEKPKLYSNCNNCMYYAMWGNLTGCVRQISSRLLRGHPSFNLLF